MQFKRRQSVRVQTLNVSANSMKTALYYLFLFSGLTPALYLLTLTLFFLPGLLKDFIYYHENGVAPIVFSCLSGICGFIGLIRLIRRKAKQSHSLTITLLSLGITGAVVFLIVTGGREALEWVLSFEEPDEWFVFVWPNIVSLTFAIALSFKKLRKQIHEAD